MPGGRRATKINQLHPVISFRVVKRWPLCHDNLISRKTIAGEPLLDKRFPIFRIIGTTNWSNAVGELQLVARYLVGTDSGYPHGQAKASYASSSGSAQSRDEHCCRGDPLSCCLYAQCNEVPRFILNLHLRFDYFQSIFNDGRILVTTRSGILKLLTRPEEFVRIRPPTTKPARQG